MKERPIHVERPMPPLDYGADEFLADRRKDTGPVPVSFAFLVGFVIGLLLIIPVWLLVAVAALWLL